MKGTGLRLAAVVVFLLVFAGANVGAFLLGRASVEYKVSWEDTQVFYAEILERRENSFLVEGLSVNDVNHQGQFSFTAEVDTRLLWNGAEISLEDGVRLVLARRAAGERMKDAVRQVAADTGLNRNELYAAALAAGGSGA